MELGNERGIKTGKWLTNELSQSSDINAVGELTYLNVTDLLALLAEQGKATGSTKDTVIAGLLLEWNNLLASDLRAGACVSFSGYYLDSLGMWGFNASAGEIFSVVLPKDVAVVVESGSASDRYDTIEIRPVQTGYDTESRKFKDPVTGAVTSGNMATKIEYTCEVQVLKGTSGGGSAPTHTAGWIKVAEVFVLASASVIAQSDIKDVRDSDTWTTEASNTVYKNIVRALDIDIEDAGSKFVETKVEGALQELGGAKLISNTNKLNLLLYGLKPYTPEPWNKSLFAKITTPTHTGTADTNLSMALKDVGATFTSVAAGAVVENTADHVFATVLYKSGTDTLYLDWDAFPDGNEGYKIYTEPTLPSECIELTGALLDGDGVKLADTNTANHLLDADGTDWTTIMSVGDWAMNLNTGLVAKITAVAAHDLTLQWDCFPNGNEPYMLFDNLITISDGDSLLNNAVIPEMNISGRFVKGGMTSAIIQGDAIRNITGTTLIRANSVDNVAGRSPTGAFISPGSYSATTSTNSQQNISDTWGIKFDASAVVPTASENRPRNLSMVMVMRIK